MIDKSHCFMNMEDEDEYVDFYDFSKTYENHPLLLNKAIKEAPSGEENKDGTGEDWEDCDFEDGSDEGEEVVSSDKEFQINSKSAPSTSSKDFSLVEKPNTSNPTTSDGFTIESVSSIKSHKTADKKANTGKSREEVFMGLDIKKAELLSSDEIKLGSGKIIGNRKWNYIYKQKPRMPEDR